MSEKKLLDDDLKNVTGGVGVVYTSVSKGDRFTYKKNTSDYCVVRQDYEHLNNNTMISVDWYGKNGFLVTSETTRTILSETYYYDHLNSDPNYIPR